MSDPTSTDDLLYMGIDLGTFRSVVATSSGQEAAVLSYVGWSKDFVARRALGKDIVYGAEALDQRQALNLHRPLQGGVLREGTALDEQAVAALIGHLIEVGGGQGRRLRVAVGVPAECLRINKLAMKQAVGAYAEKMIVVSEPFAVAYGLGTLNNAVIIDIGAGTVDFCIMHGTVPDERDQRSLLSAGDAIDQQLYERLRERIPEATVTMNMARQLKETYGFVGTSEKLVKVKLPVSGKMVAYNITDEISHACAYIVPPIIETTMRLIGAADPEYQPRLRNNILLSGGCSQLRGLADYLTRQMEPFEPCRFRCIPDPLNAGARGALALVKDMPEEFFNQL